MHIPNHLYVPNHLHVRNHLHVPTHLHAYTQSFICTQSNVLVFWTASALASLPTAKQDPAKHLQWLSPLSPPFKSGLCAEIPLLLMMLLVLVM